jgi:hypothetical protein
VAIARCNWAAFGRGTHDPVAGAWKFVAKALQSLETCSNFRADFLGHEPRPDADAGTHLED